MHAEVRERLLAELRAVAALPRIGVETSLGRPDDVILLVQPLRTDNNHEALAKLIDQIGEKNFLTGAEVLGQHGIAGVLIANAIATGCGFHLDLTENEGASLVEALFAESAPGTRAVVTTRPKAHLPLSNFVDRRGAFTAEAVGRVTRGDLRIRWMGETALELSSSAELLAAKEKCPAETGH